MNFEAFKTKTRNAIPIGTAFRNPGGGTSVVQAVSDTEVSYRRGNSTIHVSLRALFDAYWHFRGGRVFSTDLQRFAPSVFDSNARPAGHSCNCTFLFLLLQRLGVINQIQGDGVRGHPYFVDIATERAVTTKANQRSPADRL